MSSIYSRSYLIHTISKEKDKAGESAINEIIEKILKESGIKGFVVNSRIINTFTKKIWLLKSKVERMSYFVGIEFDMFKLLQITEFICTFLWFLSTFFCREGEALPPLWRIPIVYRVELTGYIGGRDCREAFCRLREGCELRLIRV